MKYIGNKALFQNHETGNIIPSVFPMLIKSIKSIYGTEIEVEGEVLPKLKVKLNTDRIKNILLL